MGDNLFGQLETGVNVDVSISNPITAVPLPEYNIIDICCQEMFTIILSESGYVYGCGFNSNGELGLGDKLFYENPIFRTHHINIFQLK